MTLLLLILTACNAGAQPPINPTQLVPTLEPPVPPPAAIEAKTWLAEQLNVSDKDVILMDMQQMEWPDACLGLAEQGELCAQVMTPGWKFDFVVNEKTYEVRTNEAGDAIRMRNP